MSIAIDLIIVLIAGFCIWRGYKNGIIRGVCGVLVLVISIFAANVISTAYSGEFTGMLKPFVGGIVDTVISDILDSDSEDQDAAAPAGESIYGLAYSAMRKLGLPPKAAENIADFAAGDNADEASGGSFVSLTESITDKLSSVIAYVVVFGICFVLLAIVFAVIGNLLNFVFSIPGLEKLDSLLGAVFGLAKGLIIVFTIAMIVRYIGLIATPVIDKTVILKYIVNINPIAGILGI